jgi:hypothetical protein
MNLLHTLTSINEDKIKSLLEYYRLQGKDISAIYNTLDEMGQLGYILNWLEKVEHLGLITARTYVIAYYFNIHLDYTVLEKVLEQGGYVYFIKESPKEVDSAIGQYIWGLSELFEYMKHPF